MMKLLTQLFKAMGCQRLAMLALACGLFAPHVATACVTVSALPLSSTAITKRGDTFVATTTFQGNRSSNAKCGWQDLKAFQNTTQINAFGFVVKPNEYSLGNFSSTGTCIFNPTIVPGPTRGVMINLDVDVVSTTCQVKFQVIRTFTGTYDGTGDIANPSNNVIYQPTWRIVNTATNAAIGSITPTGGIIRVPNEPTRTCSFTAPNSIVLNAAQKTDFTGQNSLVSGTLFTTQIQCPAMATAFTPKVAFTYTEASSAGLTTCAAANIDSAISAAQGVGFRLTNVDNQNLPVCGSPGVSTTANLVNFPTSSAGQAYSASRTIDVKYVQTGTTVTEGSINATVTFTTSYQ